MIATKSGVLDFNRYIIYYSYDKETKTYYYILDLIYSKKRVYQSVYNQYKHYDYVDLKSLETTLYNGYGIKGAWKNCRLSEYKIIGNNKYYVFRSYNTYMEDIKNDENYYDKYFIENGLMDKFSDLD